MRIYSNSKGYMETNLSAFLHASSFRKGFAFGFSHKKNSRKISSLLSEDMIKTCLKTKSSAKLVSHTKEKFFSGENLSSHPERQRRRKKKMLHKTNDGKGRSSSRSRHSDTIFSPSSCYTLSEQLFYFYINEKLNRHRTHTSTRHTLQFKFFQPLLHSSSNIEF